MKITKYTVANEQAFNGLLGGELEFPANVVIRRAGFAPNDPELCCSELVRDWKGHRAGSRVLHGLSVHGHGFAVVEIE